jgi:uncharacterized membrane protein HdeD (DUF308 family)
MKMAWIVVIVLGVIVVILLGLLFFYNPAKVSAGASSAPTAQSQ